MLYEIQKRAYSVFGHCLQTEPSELLVYFAFWNSIQLICELIYNVELISNVNKCERVSRTFCSKCKAKCAVNVANIARAVPAVIVIASTLMRKVYYTFSNDDVQQRLQQRPTGRSFACKVLLFL